jgi:LPS-assembly protein
MRPGPAVVILFFLGFGVAMACEAASDLPRDMARLERLRESVDVQADRMEYSETERRILASGAVRVTLGNRNLYADEVSVDLDKEVLVASGHVILTEGPSRLEGDRIEYNYRTNLGVIENGQGTLESGVSFSGVEIRREGERQYALKEARFTGCRACQPAPETPDWEFRASDATIYQDEWIASRNTSFWIKGIPAMYSPVLALPMGPRRTGFLIPRLGYGSNDGFMVRQPFFWAISRSQDATLTPIYRTKRGFEIDGEYRYVMDARSGGQFSGRYLHDLRSGSEAADRGDVRWVHGQHLSPTWVFKADASYQSDRRVTRDFVDSSVTERTQRVLDSNIFLTQTTSQYMLLGLVEVTEDLTNIGETRLSRLPEVRFQWLPTPLFSLPLVGEAQTSAVYFERSGTDNAGRFDLHPVLHLPFAPVPWLASTTSVGLRETVYSLAAQPGGDTNRVLVDLGQRFGSTFLRRFEDPGFGFGRLTHIVEPSLQYEYVPWVDQQSLLQFDSVDFVSPQNRLTYRLATRLIGRSQGADGREVRTYEVASLKVAQSLNLQPKTLEFSDTYLDALTPERVDQAVKNPQSLSNGFTRATERRLSNLVVQGTIRPLPAIAVSETVAVNVEQVGVEGVNSGVEFRLREDLTLEAAHSYIRDRQVDGVVAKIWWKATKNISLDLLTRYDIRSTTLFEHTANLRFSTCCWEAGLKYTHRSKTTERAVENSVQMVFDLKMPTLAAGR